MATELSAPTVDNPAMATELSAPTVDNPAMATELSAPTADNPAMATDLSAPTVDKSTAADYIWLDSRPAALPVDKESYLVFEADGGYSISYEPKEIPEDVHYIRVYDDVAGLRRIVIAREGSDDIQLVNVGTMIIQNGYAYVAGKVISGEEPNIFLDKIYFPPFVVTFPPVYSDDEAIEHFVKNKDKIRADLVRAIQTHNYVPAKFRCLEFEYLFDCDPDISEPNLCGCCKGQIYEGGYEFCKDCGDVLMKHYRLKNHKEVSALIGRTDKYKDIDDGEDKHKGLATVDIDPSKQTSTSVN